jgi:GTPase KRas protein
MDEYKVAIMGAGGVGKSALTIMFQKQEWSADFDPTIEDSYRKTLTIDGETVVLNLIDSAGHEQYNPNGDLQVLNFADAFILVYSLIDRDSFTELIARRNQACRIRGTELFPLVLVGNKVDLKRQVEYQEGSDLAASWNIPFFETSAKTPTNVDAPFFQIYREIRRIKEKHEKVVVTLSPSEKSNCCCSGCVIL